MKEFDFAPDEFFDKLYSGVSSPYSCATAENVRQISRTIKESLEEKLSLDKIPGKISVLRPVEISCSKFRGYTFKRMSVDICEGWKMLYYLLVPEKSNGNGVVAVCGHGYGVRQILRLGKSGKYRKINFLDNYQKNFAVELCKRGNTVIAFEPVAFGEARLKKDSHKPFYISSCETVSAHSLLYGFSCASLRIYQAVRCLDLLEKLGLDKLGMMGISGGGLVTLYTACIDKRVEGAVVSGYVNTFRDSVLSRWHCYDNYIPGLMEIGEMSDFAASIAPRRLLLECGKKDALFPVEGSEQAIARIEKVYDMLGCRNNFDYDVHKGKHSISGVKSFGFFEK